jgi:hypothetical protein
MHEPAVDVLPVTPRIDHGVHHMTEEEESEVQR